MLARASTNTKKGEVDTEKGAREGGESRLFRRMLLWGSIGELSGVVHLNDSFLNRTKLVQRKEHIAQMLGCPPSCFRLYIEDGHTSNGP